MTECLELTACITAVWNTCAYAGSKARAMSTLEEESCEQQQCETPSDKLQIPVEVPSGGDSHSRGRDTREDVASGVCNSDEVPMFEALLVCGVPDAWDLR